jgi:hypothetical protein
MKHNVILSRLCTNNLPSTNRGGENSSAFVVPCAEVALWRVKKKGLSVLVHRNYPVSPFKEARKAHLEAFQLLIQPVREKNVNTSYKRGPVYFVLIWRTG